MLNRTTMMLFMMLHSFFPVWGGQALHTVPSPPSPGIRGRITIGVFVARKPVTDPLGKVQMYLVKVEDSRHLKELQRGCRHATAQPKADPLGSGHPCALRDTQTAAFITAGVAANSACCSYALTV